MEPERLVVGRIVSLHGLRGECVVEVLSDAPERFAPGSRLGVGDPDAAVRMLTVATARRDRRRLLVRFAEASDRDAAEAFRGLLLSIPAMEAKTPAPGAYYPHQLEGLVVRDPEGALLGTLADVLANPANDIWVVRTAAGRDVLVPAVKEFVRGVDLDAGVIVVAPIEGMFD
jgi:16S rRNA processing protein RimM